MLIPRFTRMNKVCVTCNIRLESTCVKSQNIYYYAIAKTCFGSLDEEIGKFSFNWVIYKQIAFDKT